MESVRKKTTIMKREECLDPFAILPLDLMVEILMKFPAKSIARLVFVSKYWSSIIRSKEFTKLYITQSSSCPRFLFICSNTFLKSYSQEDPCSDHQRVNINCYPADDIHLNEFSAPVRGLICLQIGTKVKIGNPSTSQFLTLPKVKTTRKGLLSFFGYDPMNDVYKVLCMTVLRVTQRRESLVVSDEHQVFTLGLKQKWRKIACKHPHLPPTETERICINGIMYYYAWIKSEESLICFDLTSEEFSVIKLPEDINCLVNYDGKIALCRQMYNATLNLWVLQDAKREKWSKVSHLVPSWTDLVGTSTLSFKGTLSTGQLIFAPLSYNYYYPYFLISYNLKENNAKKVVIGGITKRSHITLYFDHIESPMILSNVGIHLQRSTITLLQESPEHLHKFCKDNCKILLSGEDRRNCNESDFNR